MTSYQSSAIFKLSLEKEHIKGAKRLPKNIEMNTEILPNANRAKVEREKIIEYLLCESHPDGRAKAAFFARYGFRVEQWEILAESLRRHGMVNPVVKTVRSEYGVSYCVEGPIETPGGFKPTIRTIWIIEEKASEPRLITAYPV